MSLLRYREVWYYKLYFTNNNYCIICSELCSYMQYTHIDSVKKIYMLCNKYCSYLIKL